MKLDRTIFGFLLVLVGWLSNYRALVAGTLAAGTLHPVSGSFSLHAWRELSYWLMAILMVLWLQVREKDGRTYVDQWCRQPFLLIFLAICSLSILWSTDRAATTFRVLVLLASTGIAAYLATQVTVTKLLDYLAWFGAAVVFLSVYMALADPAFGMQPVYGPKVWRGIFWNRNHLGSVTALFSVLLFLRLVNGEHKSTLLNKGFLLVAYVFSIAVVFRSYSATGYAVTLILHGIVLILLVWRRFAEKMTRQHYLMALFSAIVILIVAFDNLDALLRAFNRDTRLSGRVQLWAYLFEDVISRKPFAGYGFGAFWGDPVFRRMAGEQLPMIPVIGDNGFVDILLGVGAIGLTSFLLVYAVAWKSAIRQLVTEKSIASLVPLTIMSFSLLANFSFSLLIETEVLIWGLIVMIAFAPTTHGNLAKTTNISAQDKCGGAQQQ